ncbi:MAG: PIN domain-containing protein [Acidobacteriaceae bacterium]
MAVLIDTNILIAISSIRSPGYSDVEAAVKILRQQNTQLVISSQNAIEYWAVCTRPAERNGFGLSIERAQHELSYIEKNYSIIKDLPAVYEAWRSLVSSHEISGRQVHDARLVAVMLVYGIDRILTLNGADFRRFADIGISVLIPALLVSANIT